MQVLVVILVIILVYIVFIVAPSIVTYLTVFSRKCATEFEDMENVEKTYFAPYLDEIYKSKKYIQNLKSIEVEIRTNDGEMLKGVYIDGGYNKTVICVHGYWSTPLNNFSVQGEFLYKNGFNLLFVYLRGHEPSGGKHIYLGLKEQYDLIEWIKWLRKNKPTEKILLYGMSLGSAVVSYASDKLDNNDVFAMVLDSGFTSPYHQIKWDCVKRHLPWMLMLPIIRLIVKIKLMIDIKEPVTEHLNNTKIPALFFHGTADETVPIAQGIENFNSCASRKDKLFVENANHTLSFIVGGKEVQNKLLDFINENFN